MGFFGLTSVMASVMTVATTSGLVLTPFGQISELTAKPGVPWYGFFAQGPNLTVVRAEKIADASCADWIKALSVISVPVAPVTEAEYQAWLPFEGEELEEITDCKKPGCDIKLNDIEAKEMGKVRESSRVQKFLQLVGERVEKYLKTSARGEYEFPGDPIDPWQAFELLGLKTSLKLPDHHAIAARKLRLYPGKVKTIHQLVDQRQAVSAKEAVLWLRDVYTDHFFDSWGEWSGIRCDEGSVTVVQAMVVELDLLKKTDLFSRIARPKMRDGIKENGSAYLDRLFLKIAESAKKKAAPTPVSTASPKT